MVLPLTNNMKSAISISQIISVLLLALVANGQSNNETGKWKNGQRYNGTVKRRNGRMYNGTGNVILVKK